MEFRLQAIVTVNVATLWQRNGRRVGADHDEVDGIKPAQLDQLRRRFQVKQS